MLEDVNLVEVEVVVGGAEHLGPGQGAVVRDGAAAVVVWPRLRMRILKMKGNCCKNTSWMFLLRCTCTMSISLIP